MIDKKVNNPAEFVCDVSALQVSPIWKTAVWLVSVRQLNGSVVTAWSLWKLLKGKCVTSLSDTFRLWDCWYDPPFSGSTRLSPMALINCSILCWIIPPIFVFKSMLLTLFLSLQVMLQYPVTSILYSLFSSLSSIFPCLSISWIWLTSLFFVSFSGLFYLIYPSHLSQSDSRSNRGHSMMLLCGMSSAPPDV